MAEEKQSCKSFKIEHDNKEKFNFLAVGCWGVYCEEGKKTIIKKKKKDDEIIIKKEKNIKRGQKTVAEIIKQLSDSYSVDTIFLAGDNVYHKSVNENTNVEDIPANYNHYDIEKQIQEGFRDCFKNPKLKNYFVIAGNHDVEDCDILEKEIKEPSWTFGNLFYNTFFPMREYNIDIMCIDTNILELIGNEELCGKNSEYLKNQQMVCVQYRNTTIVQSGKPTWRIMIGHIPYKALGHKSDKCIVDNSGLFRGLMDIYKPHIYISADEHNQQFLTEMVEGTNVALVVAGSGGTAQDDVKTCNPRNVTQITDENNKTIIIPYSYTAFGIPLFQVTKENIVIDYYIKENNSIKSNFNVKVYYNHSIETSTPQ